MAVMDSILKPGQAKPTKQSILTEASGAEIVLGTNAIFTLVGNSGECHVAFGNASMGIAAITDMFVPADTLVTLDLGGEFSSIRIFNPTAGTVDYYVLRMSKH